MHITIYLKMTQNLCHFETDSKLYKSFTYSNILVI